MHQNKPNDAVISFYVLHIGITNHALYILPVHFNRLHVLKDRVQPCVWLAKTFLCLVEKPKRTFWPAQYMRILTWLLRNSVVLSCCLVAKSWPTLFVTSWTVFCPAPLPMWFPRQEYWSRLPFSHPGNLPNPGIKPTSLALASGFFH